MPMKAPPHPGLSVLHDCLEPLNLTVSKAAQHLGVSRRQLGNNGLWCLLHQRILS